jgi:hypothetical protein
MSNNCLLLLTLIIIFFIITKNKESYKKQRRQNIRGGWRRHGKSGQTVALKGTRYPKYPTGRDIEFIDIEE